MNTSARLVEPEHTYVAANDNHRSHRAPIMDRAKSGKLFPSPEENLLAVRTINRMDAILAAAESDVTYARIESGSMSTAPDDDDGWAMGPALCEVAGRSAAKLIEDFHNGPIVLRDEPEYAPPYQHGRFRYNAAGIIVGYRINREKRTDDRDIWIAKDSPRYPDNVTTPFARKKRDPRGPAPGKTSAEVISASVNDNYGARQCVSWLRARMSPEHFEAVYDVTAGLGFNQIGTTAGYTGKQADAVGKDRVMAGLRQVARLLADWDDVRCT